ncbi:MAG: OsmC family protein [Candidatus Altiarchaeota archaeon]
MKVSFPGGMQVNVSVGKHNVLTDQLEANGGEDSAPAPFTLFLSSIAACAGYYVLSFCSRRGISSEGISLSLDTEYDKENRRISRILVGVSLPEDFPPEYRNAVLKSVESCTVKKCIQDPPEFRIYSIESK